VRALVLPVFAWSTWAQPATVVPGKTVEGAVLTSVRLAAWAQADTLVAGTTCKSDALDL
jgi:hypothetical protein